ncbi:hypothetical protein [Blastococcus brunescens]|uniref:Glycosyltransferase 2-like domain-containing protein n=1 Tax=Blastococcus brunescens TaxID=1564165 RepID=A0ABZ1BCR8_9ACTN|nr:hypothetical protein [Blastococcus sp. BMG 8361]WRL67285.1 hypothetical protein U6N30_18485 [Blastococcus sp. BMG 8361]
MTPASDLTVVVASQNRRTDLLATLPRHEAPVVLVDNASTDGTVEAVRAAHPDVDVLALPATRAPTAARWGWPGRGRRSSHSRTTTRGGRPVTWPAPSTSCAPTRGWRC